MNILEVDASTVLDGCEDLFEEYASESRGSMLPSPNYNYEQYIEFEKAGILKAIVVKKGVHIVGFAMLLITMMPHYTEKSCTIESIFVSKEHRKYGTGKKLMDFITNVAKDNDAVIMFFSVPYDSNLHLAAKGFGMAATNVIYSKEL